MPLVLDEQQNLLKDSAESFFQAKAPVSALRKLRDDADADGFSRALWREIVDMGWPGCFIPEQYAGLGLGLTELAVVMQAAGRTLSASPLFSSVVLSGSALLLGGSEAQKSGLLPQIASGELLISPALQEGPHHRPVQVETSAREVEDGFKLTGCKVFVPDGHVADKFLVTARTSGSTGDEQGISLFLVDAVASGLSVERSVMVDSRNMARVQLESVLVSADSLVGDTGGAFALVEQVADRGNIILSAEMLGSLQAAFERTLDYLKQREQFGQLIGSFQALQHRASQMFCEIELCKSVVLKALASVDSGADDVALSASLAKVQVSETFRLVSNEAIQMFGGIGMTDEEEIGFYLKRARVAQQMLGDENYHLQRYATLRGY